MDKDNAFLNAFDELVAREPHSATKWLAVTNCETKNQQPVIPAWIADMDFRSPPAVLEAIQHTLTHGILGYREWSEDFIPLFCEWQRSRHDWHIEPEWVTSCQSVITAMDIIIRAYSDLHDEIMVFSPGFGTFNRVIQHTGRQIVEVPLREGQHSYTLDIAEIEARLTPRTRMLVLCNPHNPIGKVWRRTELMQIADLCLRHDLLLLSDDVHQEIVLGSVPYTPIATLNAALALRCITFTSPCKAFNFSGLPVTQLVIQDPVMNEKIRHALYQVGVHKPNSMAMAAAEAAYRSGEPWLDAVCHYLRNNFTLLAEGLNHKSCLAVFHCEGSYLAWLDFRQTGLAQPVLEDYLKHEVGILLEKGTHFGSQGEGFMRLNFATPKTRLQLIINKLVSHFPPKTASH